MLSTTKCLPLQLVPFKHSHWALDSRFHEIYSSPPWFSRFLVCGENRNIKLWCTYRMTLTLPCESLHCGQYLDFLLQSQQMSPTVIPTRTSPATTPPMSFAWSWSSRDPVNTAPNSFSLRLSYAHTYAHMHTQTSWAVIKLHNVSSLAYSQWFLHCRDPLCSSNAILSARSTLLCNAYNSEICSHLL